MTVTQSKQLRLLLPLFLLTFAMSQGFWNRSAALAEDNETQKSLLQQSLFQPFRFLKQQPSLLGGKDTVTTSPMQPYPKNLPQVSLSGTGTNGVPRTPTGDKLRRATPTTDSRIQFAVLTNDEPDVRQRASGTMFNINTPPLEHEPIPIVSASGLLPVNSNGRDFIADAQPRKLRTFPVESDPDDLPSFQSIETDDQPVGISSPVHDPSRNIANFSLASALQGSQQPVGSTPQEPTPDDRGLHLHEINVEAMKSAALNGIRPGETPKSEVLKIMTQIEGQLVQATPLDTASELLAYAVEGLGMIEITIQQAKVFSIVWILPEPFPSEQIRKEGLEAELKGIRPILVPNAEGYIIAQMFPEKGVIFSFTKSDEPGVPSLMVNQIAIEPLTSWPFELRGERYLTISNTKAKWDLFIAVQLDPNNHKARWLLAKAYLADGQFAEAQRECKFAIKLKPDQPQYNVTLAEIIGKAGYTKEARQYLEYLIPYCASLPHLKGHAECLLGDFYRDDPNLQDFATANKYHIAAIETVKPLCTSTNPTMRQQAKLVQMNAFLAGALDFSISNWANKEESIPQWLAGAEKLAMNLVIEENMMREYLLELAVKAISVYANCPDLPGLEKWTGQLESVAEEIISQAEDDFTIRKVENQLASAIYDVAQIYNYQGKSPLEMQYAVKAVEMLERSSTDGNDIESMYRQANLYYQIGTLEASGQAGQTAVKPDRKAYTRAAGWFAKAIPLFQQIEASLDDYEQPFLGEMYVSIGATYWKLGEKDYALQITEYGVEKLEDAVANHLYTEKNLATPYKNLSTMYEATGRTEEGEEYHRRSKQAATQNLATGGSATTKR